MALGLGDSTEIERPQAQKTEYLGALKDGKIILAIPYRKQAIPCGLVTYSSRTVATRGNFWAFATLKDLLGKCLPVLDQEVSYLELLLRLVAKGIHFVIRLNLGRHLPKF